MIIDCHGHYTTAPKQIDDFRAKQLASMINAALFPKLESLGITDDMLRESVETKQLKLQSERGTDMSVFSPKAIGMQHHFGDLKISRQWAAVNNDLIHRLTQLYPQNFVGGAQLPQVPGLDVGACVEEIERVAALGFVSVNLNPDPSGGHWTSPPLTDKYWFPIYEKLVEFDMPAMVHVSGSCCAGVHATGAHYINGDVTAIMQLIQGDLFKEFPTLRIIVPHGGGALPYQYGRFRGLAINTFMRSSLEEHLFKNVYLDTCVYDQRGIDMLTEVIPTSNLIFSSEMVGAVKGKDPLTGHNFDDTKRYVDATPSLTDEQRHQIFDVNPRKVFPRLAAKLAEQGR